MTILLSTHDGSVQKPYHFWLAYFIPACEWLIDNPDTENIQMIDCGPMNPWIEQLQKYRNIEIIKPITALNKYLDDSKSIVFRKLDHPKNFLEATYLNRIDEIKSTFFNPQPSTIDIGILQRNVGPAFYNTDQSELKGSGADLRKITNIESVKATLDKYGNTEIIDTTEYTAQDSVNLYSGIKCLIGQYGAGLTNMVWMNPNSLIIEIRGPGIKFSKTWDAVYRTLAEKLGHRAIALEAQQEWFGDVDVSLIEKTVGDNL